MNENNRPEPATKTRLSLKPGKKGTKKLLAEYGDRLVAVRYKYDEARKRRIKTIEIIVEEVEWPGKSPRLPIKPENPTPSPSPRQDQPDQPPENDMILLRINYHEHDLRKKIKKAGAKWNPHLKLWLIQKAEAKRLNLLEREVKPDKNR
jgi:hypothetical protein